MDKTLLSPDGEKPSDLELRFAIDLDLRADPTNTEAPRRLSGYAAVFNSPAKIRSWSGDFSETIAPGAFADSIKRNTDIRLLHEHDYGQLLARTAAGNLRLSEDSKGLRFEADLPDTQLGRDVYEQVRVGNLRGMSFGFSPVKMTQTRDAQGNLRAVEHQSVDLREVTITSVPYYPKTSVALRSLFATPTTPGPDLSLRARLARARLPAA